MMLNHCLFIDVNQAKQENPVYQASEHGKSTSLGEEEKLNARHDNDKNRPTFEREIVLKLKLNVKEDEARGRRR